MDTIQQEIKSAGVYAIVNQAKKFSKDLFNDITNIKEGLDQIHAHKSKPNSYTQEDLLSAEDHLKKLKTAYVDACAKRELHALLNNANRLQLLDGASDSTNADEQNQRKENMQLSKKNVEQEENVSKQAICDYLEAFNKLTESHNQMKPIIDETYQIHRKLEEQEDQELLDITQTCIVQEKESLHLQLMETAKQNTELQNTKKIMEEEIQQQEQQLRNLINDYNQAEQNFSQFNKIAVTKEQEHIMASQPDLLMNQIYVSDERSSGTDSVWKNDNHYYWTFYDESKDQQSNLSLTLAISYTKDEEQSLVPKEKITGAQADIQDLLIDDLIENAVEANDVHMLVNSVKNRYCIQLPLLKELKNLRSKFPVDYIPQKQLLRVIIGASCNMICNFLVPSTYPVVGQISLTTIEGHSNPEVFLEANNACRTLTEWTAYLEQQLQTIQ